ncbi:MAG: nucleotide-binding protein [Saccharofermentanales bacterium]
MTIAVLSGKGGTGKTTVSASFAIAVKPSQYVDCDVEEPNGYIFLKPEITQSVPVEVKIPFAVEALCKGCGDCARACQFNALAVTSGKLLVFPEICHHCGACLIVCKPKALFERMRTIGVIEMNEDRTFIQGKLGIGEPVAVPIIKEIKKYIRKDVPVILDCSPGASCTVVQSLKDSDYCLLVTEPTPFGLHDLKIAVLLVLEMNLPFGIVINKASGDSKIIKEYCNKEGLEILMEIPYSKEIAKAYSKGILPVEENTEWKKRFELVYDRIRENLTK